jgi:hypothetical protein
MPMPRLPETHHRNIETRKAFQEKKNNAAIAPTWNRPMKIAVTQLIWSSAAAFRSSTWRSIAMFFFPCPGLNCLDLKYQWPATPHVKVV